MWQKLGDSIDVVAQQGQRYRATVSVSKSISKADVLGYLQGHGWSDVLLYDEGAGDQYPPDWGDHEPDSNGAHRYIRGEATRTDETTTVPQSHWILTIYDIRHVYEYVPDGTKPAPVPSSGPSVRGFVVGLLLTGAGAAGTWWALKKRRR